MCDRCNTYFSGETDASFNCKDCKADTSMKGLQEHYMVSKEAWQASGAGKKDTLCIGCLEKRLSRKLNPDDFRGYPINYLDWPSKSDRLFSRIIGWDF